MRCLLAVRAAFVLLLLSALAGCGPERPKPLNVLMVCLDTVRFDTFWLPERTGHDDPFSPWAERAIRFRRALAPAPWTLPSVASVFTGRYPNAHGAGAYADSGGNLRDDVPPPLVDGIPTLPERLRARGYRVQGFVAQTFFRPAFGLQRGFDGFAQHPKAPAIFQGADRWLADRQEKADSAPYFLYLHFLEAHREHMQTPEILERRSESMPAWVRDAAIQTAPAGICADPTERLCRAFQSYAHAVVKLRRGLAGLLDRLERRGLLSNTIVLVYSDHGEEFHDHHDPQARRGTDVRGIYGFGHGQSLYQELLHVPLLVWHPQHDGRDIEADVSLVDVAPTLLAWLGIEEIGAEWDGIDLSDPSILDGTTAPTRPIFASEVAFGPPEIAVIAGRWKRVQRAAPDERLFFDLTSDPGESRPAPEGVEAKGLDALIAAYAARAPTGQRAPAELETAEIEALRALGYVEQVDVD